MRMHDSEEEFALFLREQRPVVDRRWAAQLDERAAAGFPRGGGQPPGTIRSWLGNGGWKVPAGALATLAVLVIAVASNYDGSSNPNPSSTSLDQPSSSSGVAASPSQGATESGVTQSLDGATGALAYPDSSQGEIAPGTENRKVDRDTQLSLSAKPEDVREVSNEVISITRSLGGIVASSQVSESPSGSSATLELTIPSRNLDAAVDRMTELADVDSLNETATDITKPFVSAEDEVKDAQAERRQLLKALGNATTVAEADALRLQIADARRRISQAEARFETIARQARLSSLSVTVTSNPNASVDRTLGDWFDDAVGVLRAIAGVLLIAGAILIPLGLIAAIAYWIISQVRHRRRENSLDD